MGKLQEEQTRVAIYLRVSTEEQAERYGIDLQLDSVKALIHSKGNLDTGEPKMVLAGKRYIYTDEGISGTTPLSERPGFTQLVEDFVLTDNEKPFDAVAVYKIDRFARRLKILLEAIDFFDENEIKLISANESIDTSTPFGKAILGIVGVIAELELETTKKRTQDGRRSANKQGKVMGRHSEFGYIKDKDGRRKILEPEAEVVEYIFSLLLDFRLSTNEIATRLTKEEYLSPGPSAVKHEKHKGDILKQNDLTHWRGDQVKKILEDEVYLGKHYYGKYKDNKKQPKEEWKLAPHRHEPIIDTYTFKRVQELLKKQSNKTRTKPSNSQHTYLLSGLLKCDHCKDLNRAGQKTSWIGSRKKIGKDKYSYSYHCGRKNTKKYSKSNRCKVLPIPAEQLEEYVVKLVKKILSNPKSIYEYRDQLKSNQLKKEKLRSRRKRITDLLNSLPKRKKNLSKQHEIGVLKDQELKDKVSDLESKSKEYEKELKEIDYQLGEQAVSDGYLRVFTDFTDRYSQSIEEVFSNRDKVAEILNSLIDSIVIYSRPVTDEDAIAGRKVEGQMIPESINIIFRLPDALAKDLFIAWFGAESANL